MKEIISHIGSHSGAYATLLSVFAILTTYLANKKTEKTKAARLIYQEIRRAQIIIKDYIKFGEYKFANKIIPNNSWKENAHLFAGNFTIDEIDTITNLYSSGEYLDNLIQQISDITFTNEIQSVIQSAQDAAKEHEKEKDGNGKVKYIPIKSPWKNRLDIVTEQIDLIENTPIFSKLAKLAKYKG